jgi:CRISPR/Cas system-associated endoribonuclease Cas2
MPLTATDKISQQPENCENRRQTHMKKGNKKLFFYNTWHIDWIQNSLSGNLSNRNIYKCLRWSPHSFLLFKIACLQFRKLANICIYVTVNESNQSFDQMTEIFSKKGNKKLFFYNTWHIDWIQNSLSGNLSNRGHSFSVIWPNHWKF